LSTLLSCIVASGAPSPSPPASPSASKPRIMTCLASSILRFRMFLIEAMEPLRKSTFRSAAEVQYFPASSRMLSTSRSASTTTSPDRSSSLDPNWSITEKIVLFQPRSIVWSAARTSVPPRLICSRRSWKAVVRIDINRPNTTHPHSMITDESAITEIPRSPSSGSMPGFVTRFHVHHAASLTSCLTSSGKSTSASPVPAPRMNSVSTMSTMNCIAEELLSALSNVFRSFCLIVSRFLAIADPPGRCPFTLGAPPRPEGAAEPLQPGAYYPGAGRASGSRGFRAKRQAPQAAGSAQLPCSFIASPERLVARARAGLWLPA